MYFFFLAAALALRASTAAGDRHPHRIEQYVWLGFLEVTSNETSQTGHFRLCVASGFLGFAEDSLRSLLHSSHSRLLAPRPRFWPVSFPQDSHRAGHGLAGLADSRQQRAEQNFRGLNPRLLGFGSPQCRHRLASLPSSPANPRTRPVIYHSRVFSPNQRRPANCLHCRTHERHGRAVCLPNPHNRGPPYHWHKVCTV